VKHFPLIPAQAGIQGPRTGSPLEFIPDVIGDGDERRPNPYFFVPFAGGAGFGGSIALSGKRFQI
jgi:hypothetical protein